MTSIAIARPLTVRASELTDGTPRRTVIPHFQLTSKVELSGGRQFLHRRDALIMWHRGPAWHPAFLCMQLDLLRKRQFLACQAVSRTALQACTRHPYITLHGTHIGTAWSRERVCQ